MSLKGTVLSFISHYTTLVGKMHYKDDRKG